MRVSGINKQNFEGQFKNTKTLEFILNSANNVSLNRFNRIIEKASSTNDKMIYSFDKKQRFKTAGNGFIVINDYILSRKNNFTNLEEKIYTVEETCTNYGNDKIRASIRTEILEAFNNFLENFYSVKNNSSKINLDRNEKIKYIIDKLI